MIACDLIGAGLPVVGAFVPVFAVGDAIGFLVGTVPGFRKSPVEVLLVFATTEVRLVAELDLVTVVVEEAVAVAVFWVVV